MCSGDVIEPRHRWDGEGRRTAAPRPGAARPAHLQPRYLALVAVGGAVGTAARATLAAAYPAEAGALPVATLAINVAGSFLLGVLLEALAWRGDDGGARALRLLLGTGVLGGFTTYSALAADTLALLADASVVALGYAAGTLLAGAVAGWLGILAAAAARGRRA